jgi:4-amino-4-deoxy-L-arabinose transferase-like glycosyltransferase
VALAFAVRLAWVLAVPTVPVSDFAMYRESANYLSEFGHLDPGFIYMPGFVVVLAWVKSAGGALLAEKMIGVLAGTVGAAAVFAIALGLVDDADASADRTAASSGHRAAWRRVCPCPNAVAAALIFALWPAGVAMSSVVGTDVPAAALLALALALLVTLGPRRPTLAAIAFGVTLGLAAWIRAVALPLSALAFLYWWAARQRLRRAALLTAAGVAATLIVLSPWAIRHVRHSGTLYFTDDHGGITALIGANPNSEGTYTRALNQMFKDVTGKSVLDEPHRETDRAAYAMAREWFRFEPGYALGLAALKADRLFDPEHRLLYWSILRPGVLVGRPAAWFAARRDAIVRFADAFGLTLAGLALAGVAAAVVRRRWPLLILVPFQLAYVATYATFFAEPRYRLPIEFLALPFVALALGEIAAAARAAMARSRVDLVHAAKALGPALVVVVVWRFAWPALLERGTALRARHRWAVSEAVVDGARRLLLWAPAPPLAAQSPLAGSAEGVHVRAGAAAAPTALRVRLGGGPLPAGKYALRFRLESASGAARFWLGGKTGDVVAGTPAPFEAEIDHPGGPLTLAAATAGSAIWIGEATVKSEP